jgi:hypothetical protein
MVANGLGSSLHHEFLVFVRVKRGGLRSLGSAVSLPKAAIAGSWALLGNLVELKSKLDICK